jgi:hypothetical protein
MLTCSAFARGSKGDGGGHRVFCGCQCDNDNILCSLCETCPQERPANMTVMRDVRDKGASKSAEGRVAY